LSFVNREFVEMWAACRLQQLVLMSMIHMILPLEMRLAASGYNNEYEGPVESRTFDMILL